MKTLLNVHIVVPLYATTAAYGGLIPFCISTWPTRTDGGQLRKKGSLTCAITGAAGVNSHRNVPLVLPPPPECSELMSMIMDKSRLRLKPKKYGPI